MAKSPIRNHEYTTYLFEVRENMEGRFYGVAPSCYIQAMDMEEAQTILGRMTNASSIKYPQFYQITPVEQPIYHRGSNL